MERGKKYYDAIIDVGMRFASFVCGHYEVRLGKLFMALEGA